MTNSVISIIAWLGGTCFCGILPLGFAAILYFTSRKRGQVGSTVGAAKKTTVAALSADSGLVRLHGRIAALENAIDGSPENALVYLRLKIEIYHQGDESGWRGLIDKTRCSPFQLDDGSGMVWVNPEGLDKQLVGAGIIPTEDQIQAVCILLNISPDMLRGKLRFNIWELRAGQTMTVVGCPTLGQTGFGIARVQGQPFIISPLLGQELDSKISTQSKTARIWMLSLGIPGLLFLLCGFGGALVSMIRVLTSK